MNADKTDFSRVVIGLAIDADLRRASPDLYEARKQVGRPPDQFQRSSAKNGTQKVCSITSCPLCLCGAIWFSQTQGGPEAYHRFFGVQAVAGSAIRPQDRSRYFAHETVGKVHLALSTPKFLILPPG